jgi:hypothetical protein
VRLFAGDLALSLDEAQAALDQLARCFDQLRGLDRMTLVAGGESSIGVEHTT